jgi:hypothetical protein
LFISPQIVNSPLDEHWNVDLYGRIALEIDSEKRGNSGKIFFDGSGGSVGYAGFGGRS